MSDTRTRMIPHGGYVVVCDGRKALVLRNVSVHPKPDLQVQLAFEAPPNPPTHAQGTDRPPRVRLGDQRSAIAQTDWHDLAERRFAKAVAHALDAFDPVTALSVVAPPKNWIGTPFQPPIPAYPQYLDTASMETMRGLPVLHRLSGDFEPTAIAVGGIVKGYASVEVPYPALALGPRSACARRRKGGT